MAPLAQALFAPEPVDAARYDFPLARFRAALRREIGRRRRERVAAAPPRPSAQALLERLLPPAPRLGEGAWRRCECRLTESWRVRHDDPDEMLQLAGAASLVAERIDPATRGPRALADLQARTLAALGKARRVAMTRATPRSTSWGLWSALKPAPVTRWFSRGSWSG